jgi:SAM-dependent methyltransferase
MDASAKEYWESIASVWSDDWPRPPLQPVPGDVAVLERWAAGAAQGRAGAFDAILLGVTRRIAGMQWPEGTRLAAVDGAAAMIEHVWRGAAAPTGARALLAGWDSLPVPDASCDFVACDCPHAVLGTWEQAGAVYAEVRRVLRPGGLFCIRAFIRGDPPDTVDRLFKGLARGEVRNLDAFRWFVAAALQGNSPDGVTWNQVWRVWNEHVTDAGALAAANGWTLAEVAQIERWRGKEVRMSSPSWEDILGLAAAGGFELIERATPPHEFGARFPLVAMRAR